MTVHPVKDPARDTVIIVGGRGGLQARYRDAVERIGYQCRCYEERVSAKAVPASNRIALVIVMVSMVSHPLLAQARAIAGESERIVYLRTPSVSSLRQALGTMAEPSPPRPQVVTAVYRPNARATTMVRHALQSLAAA